MKKLKENQYKSDSQINTNDKTNYLSLILGEVGTFALIAGLIWHFVRKEKINNV